MPAIRHARALRALAVALVFAMLSAMAPAFASSAPAPARALPVRAARRAVSIASVTALGTYQDKDLTPGGSLRDWVDRSNNSTDSWAFVAHPGQTVSFSLTGDAGTKMKLALFSSDSFSPLLTTSGNGYPQKISSYDVTKVTFYYLEVGAVSGRGHYTLSYDITDAPARNDVARIAGHDRFATALALAKQSWPDTATTVVIATGMDYADGLAASALCGSYDAPLLLSKQSTISPDVLAYLDKVAPSKIFILGGPKAIGSKVASAVAETTSDPNVERIQGHDRVETAAMIAAKVKAHEGAAFGKKCFLVDATGYADALSVGPVAFAKKWPILLSPAGNHAIPAVTKAQITSSMQTYIVGGGIKQAYYKTLASGKNTTPIAAGDRLATSLKFANYAVDHKWAKWDTIAISSGYGYADALAGGPWVGKRGGVMLLSSWLYLQDPAYYLLEKHTENSITSSIRLLGGRSTLFGAVLAEADDAIEPVGP